MSATTSRSWQEMRAWCVELLERTGTGLDGWRERVAASGAEDEAALRAWLDAQGVHGYAQLLVVMERFGYPDWFTSSADELLEAQYAGRPALREVYDAVLAQALPLGELVVQVRKTYVCLVTPRRTFAQLRATRTKLDLGLRLPGVAPEGRLRPAPSALGNSTHRIALSSVDEVDDEVAARVREAYAANL